MLKNIDSTIYIYIITSIYLSYIIQKIEKKKRILAKISFII